VSEKHSIMDGKVHIYRRRHSRFWQCCVYLNGENHRQSTRQENIAYAIEFTREWALDKLAEERLRLRGLDAPPKPRPEEPARRIAGDRKFSEAAAAFVKEYETLTSGERNPEYVKSKARIIRLYLNPFFGAMGLSQVTAAAIQDYRMARMAPPDKPQPRRFRHKGRDLIGRPLRWKQPSRSSLHQEIVCLRQVLKVANRKGWIGGLPDTSAPYKSSGKVSHRAWFSPTEFEVFLKAVRERAERPKRDRWKGECETLLDYVLFMVGTGLRPDEASRLQYRDVSVVMDASTQERILEIEVRGKRGVGYCKSMPEAVEAFVRMRERNRPTPEDVIFGAVQRELLNAILSELGMKEDRDGNQRTAYSLRHTYICFRLMEGADIYQLAKNCRTSVEMIEKFYAAHIKNALDASAINVRKPRPAAQEGSSRAESDASPAQDYA